MSRVALETVEAWLREGAGAQCGTPGQPGHSPPAHAITQIAIDSETGDVVIDYSVQTTLEIAHREARSVSGETLRHALLALARSVEDRS